MQDLHLTHGGFYRHFKSKDELFAEAFEHGHGEIFARIALGHRTGAERGGGQGPHR